MNTLETPVFDLGIFGSVSVFTSVQDRGARLFFNFTDFNYTNGAVIAGGGINIGGFGFEGWRGGT